MEILQRIIESLQPIHLVGLVIFLLTMLAFVPQDRDDEEVFSSLPTDLARPPAQALKQLFNQASTLLLQNEKVEPDPERTADTVKEIVLYLDEFTDSSIMNLRGYLQGMSRVIMGATEIKEEERNITLLIWRLAGSIIGVILLLLFTYSDLVMSINNYSILLPKETASLSVSKVFRNLAVAQVMSSIGLIFTLSLIMADTKGITHFLPWEGAYLVGDKANSKIVSIRNKIFLISLISFVFSLICLLAIALPRISAVIQETNSVFGFEILFPKSWESQFIIWAAFAHALLIVPMLITTALLFWGVVGLFPFTGIVLVVVYFFALMVRILLFLASKAIELFKPGEGIFIIFIKIIIAAILVLLGLVTGTMLFFVERVAFAMRMLVGALLFFVHIRKILSALRKFANSFNVFQVRRRGTT